MASALALALTVVTSFASLVAVPRVDSDWGTGLTGAVVLKNTGPDPVHEMVRLDFHARLDFINMECSHHFQKRDYRRCR
jgi:hypothetical protein